jgi:hypothetical protein
MTTSRIEDTDDATLTQRIQSEVFGSADVPKDRIALNVAGGVAELRGELDAQEDIDALFVRVSAVRGGSLPPEPSPGTWRRCAEQGGGPPRERGGRTPGVLTARPALVPGSGDQNTRRYLRTAKGAEIATIAMIHASACTT